MLSLLSQVIGTEDSSLDSLLAFVLMAGFLALLLPPLAAAASGIVSGLRMKVGDPGWGATAGLGLGVVRAIINVVVVFSLGYWYGAPWDWAKDIFCPQNEHWYYLDYDSTCRKAMRWADEGFWIGISLATPSAAAAGTWWLCHRRRRNGPGRP